MTAQILNFSDAIFKRYGMGFMLCPRCNDQTCFLPVVEQNGKGIYISALQCVGPQCEGDDGTIFNVLGGYIQGADL